MTVAKAVQKTVPVDLTAIGSADAFTNVSIKAQVNAVLQEVHIKEGQFVKKGDLLFTLDARPFEAALAQAQGTLARDQAQAELNRVEAERYAALYKAGVAAKETARPDAGQCRRAAGGGARRRSGGAGGAAAGGLLQDLCADGRAHWARSRCIREIS